jgi:hypothetical protein
MFSFRTKSSVRFRSPGRDRETDEQRLVAIESAVREALVAAEREKFALSQRLEQARTTATILAGTDTYEHETRLPERTAGLAESEAEMSRAEIRFCPEAELPNLQDRNNLSYFTRRQPDASRIAEMLQA